MTTAVTAIGKLASAEFEGEVFETLSLAARLVAAITKRAHVMRLASGLHRVNKSMKSLLDLANNALTEEKHAQLMEPATPQEIHRLAETLGHLARTSEYTYEAMRRAKLTNYSLIAGAVKTFEQNLEPLKDLADWADLAANPDDLNAVLARAKGEKERGEIYEVKRVE